ncbi:hypothetical protein ACFZDM_02480 [Streptomyces californicus]|uniref:hypothetical protein n=1 Tax=Streptomyces californicus TaxID=67351 RepID=UPI0036E9B09F
MGRSVWFVGAALAAVFALTGCATVNGDGGGGGDSGGGAVPGKAGSPSSASADPEPSGYAQPEDWTDPQRWAALPRGKRTDERGSEVEFPHTTEGAVAMAVASNQTAMEGENTTVDEQLRLYHAYVSERDQSPEVAERVEKHALDTDKMLAQDMGIAAGDPLPPGAYVRTTVVGFKVIKKSSHEVGVWVLARVVQKKGEIEREDSSYTRTLIGVEWQDGDWKLSTGVTRQAQQDVQGQTEPKMVAPGDAEFNAVGWTAIREAS